MLVNIGVLISLSVLASVLGINRYFNQYGLDYQSLAVYCLFWGMGASLISLFISKFIAKMIYGIRIIRPESYGSPDARIYQMVENAAQAAGLPRTPEVGIYESPEMNAFATGPSRSSALVAVSTGLLDSMNDAQVEGVIGHEITHIANGDMVTMTLLQGVMNAIVMFVSHLLALAVSQVGRSDDRDRGSNRMLYYPVLMLSEFVLGLLGLIVVSWFSRQREFRADAGSAKIVGPQKMISALQALGAGVGVQDPRGAQFQSFKISAKSRGLFRLFLSHPPLEERIAALQGGIF